MSVNFPYAEIGVEYALDDPNDLDALQQMSLHPWISQLVGLSQGQILECLKGRWHGLIYDGPKTLRDVILECQPKSIAVREEEALLLLRLPPPNDRGVRAHPFLVPPPSSPEQVVRVVTEHGFGENLVLIEFLQAFGGLTEDIFVNGGRFVPPDDLHRRILRQEKWVPAEGWAGSLVLFNSLDGDVVLLHKQGHVAQCMHELNALQDLGMSLDGYLAAYARWRKDGVPLRN